MVVMAAEEDDDGIKVTVLKKCGVLDSSAPKYLKLNKFKPITIGRDATAECFIRSGYLSRKHATIRHDGRFWTIKDLDSRNGTYVNQVKLVPGSAVVVLEGEMVGLGMPVSMYSKVDSLVYRLCNERKSVLDGMNDARPRKRSRSHVDDNNSRHNEVATGDEAVPVRRVNGSETSTTQRNVMESARQPQPGPSTVSDEPVRKKKRNKKLDKEVFINLVRCDARDFQLPSGIRFKSRTPDGKNIVECRPIKVEPMTPSATKGAFFEGNEIIDLCSDDDDQDLDGAIGGCSELDADKRSSNISTRVQDATKSEMTSDVVDDMFSDEEYVVSDDSNDDDADAAKDFCGYSQEDEVVIVSDDEERIVMPKRIIKKEVIVDDYEEDEWSAIIRNTCIKIESCNVEEEVEGGHRQELLVDVDEADSENYDKTEEEVGLSSKDYCGDSIERIVGALHGEFIDEEAEETTRNISPEPYIPNVIEDTDEVSSKGTDRSRSSLDVTDFFPALQLISDDDDEEEADDQDVLNGHNEKVAVQVDERIAATDEIDYDRPLYDLVSIEDDERSLSPPVSEESIGEEELERNEKRLAADKMIPSTSFYQRPDETKTNFQVDRLKLSGKSTIVNVVGATMLTTAQPMTVGRRSSLTSKPLVPLSLRSPPLPKVKQQPTEKIKRPTATKTIVLPVAVTKQKGQVSSLKKNVLHKYGNRIRAPGGGSAIPTGVKSPTKSKAIILPQLITDRRPSNEQNERCSSFNENVPEEVAKVVAFAKAKVPHKVLQKSRASRGDLLAKAMLSEAEKQPPVRRKEVPHPIPARQQRQLKVLTDFETPSTSRGPAVSHNVIGRVPCPVLVTDPRRNSKESLSTSMDSRQSSSLRRVEFSNVNETRMIESRDTSSPIPSPKVDVSDRAFNSLLKMLTWNPLWLDEQRRLSLSPPVIEDRQLITVCHMYSTSKDYVRTYLPLVLLETWESISRRWRDNTGRHPEFSLVFSGLRTYKNGKDKALFIDCYALVQKSEENLEDSLQAGWFTVLNVPVKSTAEAGATNRKTSYVKLFAYVESCRKSPYFRFQKICVVPPLLDRIAARIPGEKTLLSVTFVTKAKHMDIQTDTLFKIVMLSKMRKTLKQIETMYNISNTKLGEAMLSPKVDLCSLPMINPQRQIVSVGDITYNDSQRYAILRVTEACVTNPNLPKVSLIQGPPGTGKTAVVVALVTQLLYGDHIKFGSKKPYVILCAPSNNAVDEDVCRLMDYREHIKQADPIRIVRLGQTDQVHSRVRRIHIDALIRRNMVKNSKPFEQLGNEIKTMSAEVNSYRLKVDELRRLGKFGEMGHLRMALGELELKLARKEADYQMLRENPVDDNRLNARMRDEILMKADVIATTLGSCCQAGIEVIINNDNRPLICIVDEATQCVEPDIVQLLSFGGTKLVLVGDPQQLPATVLSKKAKGMGYEKSLFHRLYETFQRSLPPPTLVLNIQYRMHPDISRFPSNAFYDGSLLNEINMVKKYASVPFLPYKVFDVCDGKEDEVGNSSCSNSNEAIFVLRLAETLLTKDKSYNIGIITFYSEQKKIIHEMVKQSFVLNQEGASEMVEVNTVDSFQGREKDVIIVSAVRASRNLGFLKHHQRLNVAITRAKSALYICGHMNSLKQDTHWNKLVRDSVQLLRFVKVSSKISPTVLHDLVIKNTK